MYLMQPISEVKIFPLFFQRHEFFRNGNELAEEPFPEEDPKSIPKFNNALHGVCREPVLVHGSDDIV
jgi:hypothetical protein